MEYYQKEVIRIIKLLNKTDTNSILSDDCWCLIYAMRSSIKDFYFIFKDKRIKPKDNYSFLFEVACEEGCDEIVDFLIDNKHVDLSICGGRGLINSAQKNHFYIVKKLVNIEEVDTIENWDSGSALFNAFRNNNYKIVSILVKNKFILNSINETWIVDNIASKHSKNSDSSRKIFKKLLNISSF